MTDQYAVVGNPIKHSKSPQIHAAFAEQTDQQLQYNTKLIELGSFEQDVSAFFDAGGRGLNVTVPFKEDAWRMAKTLSEAARMAGAVNTLYLDDQGVLCGDNTDGVGMVRDLKENHGVAIEGARVLVLGAGGAVRGVLEPLMACRPASLYISNRTASKAVSLANDFSSLGLIEGGGFDQIQGPFDLVINGTSASLQGKLPPLPDDLLSSGACCYDMMYGAESTPFMKWADEHGAKLVIDGLGMLVEQAAQSFYIWRNQRPQTLPIIDSIRQQLSEG